MMLVRKSSSSSSTTLDVSTLQMPVYSLLGLEHSLHGRSYIFLLYAFFHNAVIVWQQPWQYMGYFVYDQADGNWNHGLKKYFHTLFWKFWQLVKMTFGYWDHSLIENMQIKTRADKLNLDHMEGIATHGEMIATIGLLHALLWQLVGFQVFFG